MLTIDNITEYAQSQGLAVEAWSELEERMVTRYLPGRTLIGVELKPEVWYWWEILDGSAFFLEAYFRNTGHTIRSWRKGWEAEKLILSL